MTRSHEKLPDVIAAVDLGSNSFHMIVARYSHGRLSILDRLREPVRLAGGLDEHGRLHPDAVERAIACLERFGQRLRDVRAQRVRVVGTNTLRVAKGHGAFMDRARAALGHPIEVISGIEEARLIYVGVLHTMPHEPGQRLVIDIGGGSTELIVGKGVATRLLESLQMGCVTLTNKYFPDGAISANRFKQARLAARMELEPVQTGFKRLGWEQAIGTSGTIKAVSDIVRAQRGGDGAITSGDVERLMEHAMRAEHVTKLQLGELTADREPIFPAGLSILAELLGVLEITALKPGDGALREGLLYDLLGRFTRDDG